MVGKLRNTTMALGLVACLGLLCSAAARAGTIRNSHDLPPTGKGWGEQRTSSPSTTITGFGITDAFRDAELLAEAAGAGLGGGEPMEQALARYESARNAASMEIYRFTCEQARLEGPSPMLLALMAALADNAADTRRFMGTVATTVAMAEFYAPNNLIRIMHAADRA